MLKATGRRVMDGETVIPAEEYTVTYSDNVNAGAAAVSVTRPGAAESIPWKKELE